MLHEQPAMQRAAPGCIPLYQHYASHYIIHTYYICHRERWGHAYWAGMVACHRLTRRPG